MRSILLALALAGPAPAGDDIPPYPPQAERCPQCHGDRVIWSAYGDADPCATCMGTGRRPAWSMPPQPGITPPRRPIDDHPGVDYPPDYAAPYDPAGPGWYPHESPAILRRLVRERDAWRRRHPILVEDGGFVPSDR